MQKHIVFIWLVKKVELLVSGKRLKYIAIKCSNSVLFHNFVVY